MRSLWQVLMPTPLKANPSSHLYVAVLLQNRLPFVYSNDPLAGLVKFTQGATAMKVIQSNKRVQVAPYIA